MGSSSSAQSRNSTTSSQSDNTVRPTKQLPSGKSKEVQLVTPAQPGGAVSTGGAPASSLTPASAMAHPDSLQREKSFGFSAAQPTYTVR